MVGKRQQGLVAYGQAVTLGAVQVWADVLISLTGARCAGLLVTVLIRLSCAGAWSSSKRLRDAAQLPMKAVLTGLPANVD